MKRVYFILLSGFICFTSNGQTFNTLKTGQTIKCLEGDDGDLQRGISSPDPRFLDKGDGTIVDLLTGLMWVKEPHSVSNNAISMTWTDAVIFCNELEFAGHNDWVLPSRKELISLLDYEKKNPALPDDSPFIGLAPQGSGYWTGTSYALNSDYAWRVYLSVGLVASGGKVGTYYVWPVRSWE
jgi:hypothetical protein